MMKLLEKIVFRRYEAERAKATADIVARFSRGNIRAQNGDCMTKQKSDKLRSKGDAAVSKLQKALAS